MSSPGATPIQLYYTTTASATPSTSNLLTAELAVNVTDKKVYTKDGGGNLITLVGTLGNQDANAVAITGGTINGAVIGGSSAAAGTFTDLTASGTINLTGSIGVPLVISGSTSSAAVRITQTGSGNAFVVEDSTNPDATPFVIDATGSVLVKAPAIFTTASTASSALQVQGSSTIARFINDANPQRLEFIKSRNTTWGNPSTVVQSGDQLGIVAFQGADGTAFIEAASILAAVDGTPGTNDMPGRLVFSTTADGASTPTERMRINSSGNVGIGTASPSEKLTVSGNASLSGNLTFTGTGNRITADFSNATQASRVSFQSSTSNGNTTVQLIPNGTGTVGGLTVYSNSDVANSSFSQLISVGATDARIVSGQLGTGSFLPMTFYTGGSERMRIDTSGNVGIGTSSPVTRLDISATSNPRIRFEDVGDFEWRMGIVDSSSFGFFSGGSVTERMRIDSSGNVMFGTTNTLPADNNVAGSSAYAGGLIQCSRDGNPALTVNRITNDGDLVLFKQAGTTEGSISVSGTTVSYNGGHLSRWSQFDNETEKPEVCRGTVLESVDAMCEWYLDGEPLPNEQATKTIVSTTVASKAVAGVFDRYDEDDEDNPYDFYIAQSGDFVIRIAQGVTVQNGDLLESAGDGTARPQADDICRSSTIAKVTSNYVSATYEDGSYCVPCILMIG